LEMFLEDIHDIAEYYRKTKISQIINLTLTVAYNFLILIFIIGLIITAIRSGSINSLFGSKHDLAREFICTSATASDNVKTYQEAQIFESMFGGKCALEGDK